MKKYNGSAFSLIDVNPTDLIHYCPVCDSDEDVRIAARKNNLQQYYCTNCETYFFPHTVHNERKKIWHDKIKWKKIRHLEKWLGLKNNN